MKKEYLQPVILVIFLFLGVTSPASAMFAQSSTSGETIDTTKMLESNDIWTHYIPVSGTARITVEMKVVEGTDVNMMLLSNVAFEKYAREPLNKFNRDHFSAIDMKDAIFYSSREGSATNAYSNSYSTIVDDSYYILIWNVDDINTKVSHPSKVQLIVKTEPLIPVKTEGNNIDETRTIEQELYWAHSFIGGKKKSVKISVIEGDDVDFLLMDEVGFKMYADKESNRITYLVAYTKFKNRSIDYDFVGNLNEKYYIVIDNTRRIDNGANPNNPIKIHLEVQEQTSPFKATSGFEIPLAVVGLLVIIFLRRK